jgi:hypothetical protein
MYFQVAYKDNKGNCELGEGSLVRTYEGGGNYGAVHANYAGFVSEILCENVNK